MRASIVGLLVGLAACGGESAQTAEPEPVTEPETSGSEQAETEGVEIEGLMGTISQMAVQRALEPKMGRFLRCFTRRYDEVEVLGGHIEMAFRIARDGTVRYVHPRASTIGDRDTERCLLETAGATRFSRPQGGEAEFAYPLDLDLPEDVRPPTYWDSSRVADAVADQAPAVRASCGAGASVTAYVAPGGSVLTAGAASEDPDAQAQLDCIADAVGEWTMPDPGSYTAKVSFDI